MGEDGRVIDRVGLAEFLVHRRNALQPEDVGLPRGQRRRTTGLRREEVAALCHMSTDYYSRLEQERGPQPSEQMIASIAQGLHLSRDERDHLFRLAGHQPPVRNSCNEHISPGILRILDRLTDTPAEIVTELGETLRQTPLSVALLGDLSRHSGASRSSGYRWFTDPAARDLYLREDHEFYSRMYVSGLRGVLTLRGSESKAAQFVELLLAESTEFRSLWKQHEIGVTPREIKRYQHPEVGLLELHCQILMDPYESHSLLVYTAVPGSESYEKLELLSVIGVIPFG
ncbi:helix-turn-helix transcriptional regulator [Mycobacteroides chelonae]|uniref:helix-turn-helix transcriptional regulator n=1 Tax=Mycobacteroides chelonae TaxID=1774 RepID=UPI000D69B7FF|nr:helix-turn-helix transcriptional regulator [Mycobacteroides chelonae]MBF9327011.1 helix-turn-helix domain-containing protein [Mycobacteroides chelonae]MBF9421188.1 helix-turn-helix domain-containing protein [Mycobacteroides chelonae]MBF9436622.1 helix-turn-helix domain-containing protein [Mycobacteroides chelonae]MBV6361099.1 helix-turn-helix domain-containing protein [Mycobacteroides chelonae]MEC4833404.1 helix-turn-helix transcriptional regulator [Mycobacteroides chelonae]